MYAIETSGLTKRFKTRTAVDALDLSVGVGETFSILGQNGAGKTTLIKMLCCLTAPTSGEGRVMGHNIVSQPGEVKRCINISPQETAVAANLSVRENLEFIAGVYGLNREAAREKAGEMMAAFSLADRERDRAKTLSGGMQRRLSIAMALISGPRVLFLDEPTLGLDVRARRELWQVIRSLKDNITVILTTHYMEEAEALSDRVAIMSGGRIVALGTVKEIVSMSGCGTLEDAFLALTEEEAGPNEG